MPPLLCLINVFTHRVTFLQGEKQEALVQHLLEVFQKWTWYKLPKKTTHGNKIYPGQVYTQFSFRTFTHPVFGTVHAAFHPSSQKVIPSKVKTWLTPRVLAYHLMCDGSYQHKRVFLHTESFSKEDCQAYIDGVNQLFGLHGYVRKHPTRKATYWQIAFPARDLSRIQVLLLPHLLPSFRYKLGL